MRSPHRFIAATLLFTMSLPALATAAASEWKDQKGATFRAEPIEALGPLAMFRTGPISSRFLPMRALSPEDCLRFHQAIASRPARASRWSDAKGHASGEFIGRLQRSEKGQLKPFDFTTVPEPELLILLFGGRRNPEAESPQFLLDNLAPFINRVQRVYPGRVATIVRTVRETNLNLRSLPSASSWLVVDPAKQFDMKLVSRYAPGEGLLMVLMTREGIPLLGGPANDVGEVMRFVDSASDMLWQLNPANPRSARDRLHYLRVVRPLEFAAGKAEPALLIDPLKVDALRQRGVTRVEAKFEIGADGAISQVELLPESEVPPPLAPALTEALRRNSFFLPAIEQGAGVPAGFRYTLAVGKSDPSRAADAAWVQGDARVDLPLKSWLVLKPIKVPERVFSMVDSISADGTVMLQAVTAGDPNKISNKSQMNAFNSDWFTAEGAASVRPVVGAKQEVDGEKFTWKQVKAENARVDLLSGADRDSHNYCIGYAWTEFESPEEMDAWLGIGSDDGLRIWLNGEQVNDKWVARTSRLDDDVVPLRLKKGPNQLLIKIQNVKGLWCFTARLRVRG